MGKTWGQEENLWLKRQKEGMGQLDEGGRKGVPKPAALYLRAEGLGREKKRLFYNIPFLLRSLLLLHFLKVFFHNLLNFSAYARTE